MEINTDNEKRINAYIADHRDCRQRNTEPVYIQDERKDLERFRLPLNLLFFNIRNGRFAAEYKSLVEKEGRELDTEDEDDAKKIQQLLLNQQDQLKQTKVLESDLERFGQKHPGIITYDGYVVNGNRRMAILKKMADAGESEFGYLLVARLPKNISQTDIWKIEAGIQLSRQEQLDYGPINTLLKLKEGRDAGLTNLQIANSLYGGFTEDEIDKSLKRLDLIEEYLEYIKKPLNYKEAEGIHEHFIVLQTIRDKLKDDGFDSEKLLQLQKIAFELIRLNISQLRLRKIKKITAHDEKALPNFLKAESKIPEINAETGEETCKKETDEDDEDSGNKSPVMTIFEDSLDIVNAEEKKDEPLVLLGRAMRNLEGIENSEHLNSQDVAEKINEIVKIIERIKAKINSGG